MSVVGQGDRSDHRNKGGGRQMATPFCDTIAEARARVPTIGVGEAMGLLEGDAALFVDVREAAEVAQSGKIRGALHVSRGMLEFRACETMPTHDKAFSKDRTIVLYCGTGGRAALCGQALQELGYGDVRNLGGFKDWIEAGGPVEAG